MSPTVLAFASLYAFALVLTFVLSMMRLSSSSPRLHYENAYPYECFEARDALTIALRAVEGVLLLSAAALSEELMRLSLAPIAVSLALPFPALFFALVSLVSLAHSREHVALFALLAFSVLFLDVSSAIALFGQIGSGKQDALLWVSFVGLILLALLFLFSLFHPALKRFDRLEQTADGTYVRPRFLLMAFLEWAFLASTGLSLVLILVGIYA